MKKGTVTIHDIARHLSLDSSTISRALNDSPRVTVKTKERVRKAAAELGYRPNLMAAGLRTQRSKTIGVIVPWISRHFFSSAISGIEQVAYQEGFRVMICQSHDDYDREVVNAFALFDNRVEGVLASIAMDTTSFDHLQRFKDEHTPTVFFDRYPPGIESCQVVIDDFDAAYRVTEHLIQQGSKRIAHFSGPRHLNIYRDRYEGYKKALADYDLALDPALVFDCRLLADDGIKGAQYLLSLDNSPGAIFSANDLAALSAMRYIQKNSRLSIPGDIAIAGFSNSPSTSIIEPGLTTVDQSGEEIGKAAAKQLIAEIRGEVDTLVQEQIVIPSKLIIRGSSYKQ
ncbi:MAG: LacI family transcriptional regulator [Cytophagales bacterium]|nr:LacI family transcriptional regulator [Cytophagales bacterium]